MTTLTDTATRADNLRAVILRAEEARRNADQRLDALRATRGTIAASGDLDALDVNADAIADARADAEEADRDLADARGWLAAVVAEQDAEMIAADLSAARAAAPAAVAAFRDVLAGVAARADARLDALDKIAQEDRDDVARLRRAQGEAQAAAALVASLSGGTYADPTSGPLDRAGHEHPHSLARALYIGVRTKHEALVTMVEGWKQEQARKADTARRK